MPIFGKEKIILAFLNNSSLRFAEYVLSSRGVQRIALEEVFFPESVIKDSGILDAEEFAKSAVDFLQTKPKWKKYPVLLVIPEEKIFVKAFDLELGDLERKDEFRNKFIGEIPFIEDDLIIREHLSGKIFELSGIHKDFAEKFKKPFLGNGMAIAGLISVPQAIALDLNPKEKTLLLAFYDNDLAFVLSQNARVLFSETERVSDKKVRGVLAAFDHFVAHVRADEVRSVSLILGEDEREEELKTELEARGYAVGEIQKIHILDFIANYYWKNQEHAKDWDMFFAPVAGWRQMARAYRSWLIVSLGALLLLGLGAGGWVFREQLGLSKFVTTMLQSTGIAMPSAPEAAPEIAPEVPVSEPMPPLEATTTVEVPVAEQPPIEAKKSDYSIRVFNGTFVAGEAGRLRTILQANGFTVISTGNNEDQNQAFTTIFVGSNIPEQITSELRSILEKTYQTVIVSSSPVAVEDIHIVIGKKK